MSEAELARSRPLRIDIRRQESQSGGRRALFSTLSLLVQGVVRLVISIVVGRLADAGMLGDITAALAVGSLLTLLVPSATGAAASRFVAAAQTSDDARALPGTAQVLNRYIILSSLALGPIGALYWGWRTGSPLQGLTVGVLTVGLGMYTYARGLHTGARQVSRLVRWDLGGSLLGLAGTLALVATGERTVLVLAPLALAYVAIGLGGWPDDRGGSTAGIGTREIRSYVLWTTLGTVMSAGLLQMCMLLAEARLDEISTGHFAAALNLISPAALMANAFTMVLLPALSAQFAAGNVQQALQTTRSATAALVFAMTAIFSGLVVAAPWIVTFLWGESFRPAHWMFAVLSAGPLMRAVSMPAVTSLSSREGGGARHAALSTVAGMVIACAIWVLGGSGWLPIAVGFSVAMTTTALQNVVRATQQDGHRWLSTWLLLGAGAAATVALVVWREEADLSLPVTAGVFLAGLAVWTLLNWRALRALRSRGLTP